MKRTLTITAGLTAAFAAVGGIALAAHSGAPRHSGAPNGHVARSEANGATPVVVELFTSEGCSDCPAADAVLANLTGKQPLTGVHVIALGEHVDYWNNSAWADAYSSHAFSQRQSAYATAFRNSQVYTPQMVVNGHAEFVGSDSDRATNEINAAAATEARSGTHVSLEAKSTSDNAVAVTVEVRGLPHDAGHADVYLALTEDGLSSQVRHGENAGRHLKHDGVVRQLVHIGEATSAGGTMTFSGTLPVLQGASLGKLHAVAFVQRADAGAILGGAEASLSVLQ